MSSPRQILLVGGPLDGIVHELYGSLRPEEIDFIGFGDEDDSETPVEHCYRLGDNGEARFILTRPRNNSSRSE